ncbi:MAG: hypothetical protein ACK412_08230 [Chloroherpetonaceae bacterium]
MPLILAESDVYAVEIESQSLPDTDPAQTQNLPSAEVEERQEELAILTQTNLFPFENSVRFFFNHTDKTLIGALPDLVVPPNI